MARNIDWSEPLSDEDRAWAEQRGDAMVDGIPMHERIRANDEEHGKAQKVAKQSRSERISEIDGEMAKLQNEKERLFNEQAEEDRVNAAFGGTADDAARGLGFTDNTPVDGEKPDGAPEAGETYADEKYWTKAKLTDEIEKRNEERVNDGLEPLSKSGNRSELVERLQRDDEELAGS